MAHSANMHHDAHSAVLCMHTIATGKKTKTRIQSATYCMFTYLNTVYIHTVPDCAHLMKSYHAVYIHTVYILTV